MASTGDNLEEHRAPERILKKELWAVSMTDSLTSQIRLLTMRRQRAYDRAQVHRHNGQLVPGSLCDEMAENGLQLRQALERYAEVRGLRQS